MSLLVEDEIPLELRNSAEMCKTVNETKMETGFLSARIFSTNRISVFGHSELCDLLKMIYSSFYNLKSKTDLKSVFLYT